MNPTALQTAVLVRICSHFKFSRFPRHSRSLPMFFLFSSNMQSEPFLCNIFWLAKTWISNLLVENPIFFFYNFDNRWRFVQCLMMVLVVLTWQWQSCKRVTRWEWCSMFDKVQPIKMIYALLRKQYLHPLLNSTSPAFLLCSSNTTRSAPAQEPPAADLIWNPLPHRPDVQCAHSTHNCSTLDNYHNQVG